MRRDDVLSVLSQHPTGLSDSELGAQLGVLDQAVNGLCRALALEGLIIRDRTRSPMVNIIAHDYQAPGQVASRREWFTEASVRSATVRYLSFAGAHFTATSDEITATLGGRKLHVVVTGFPVDKVVTSRQRFADSVLSGVLLRGRWAQDRVILAVPAMPRYVDLVAGAAPMLDRIGVQTWLVAEDGTVGAA